MIVVTGGTGTVGSRLVELLLQRGQRVRVFSRDADKSRARFGGRVDVAVGDFDDLNSIKAAFAGADRIFLLTAGAAEPGTQLGHERNVIAAAREADVRRVVKLSVLGADEQAPTHYARLHRTAEKELAASGLEYTILRPAGFMQNLFEWAAGGSFRTCAEDGRAALVDARDIAAVAATVLTEDGHDGRTYTLTGPEVLSYDEAAATLSEATGQQITHVRVPPEVLVQAMTGAGLPHWLAEDLAAQFRGYATGQVGHGGEVNGDVTTVTGREPRTFDAFAREEFAAVMGADALGRRRESSNVITSTMPNILTGDIDAAVAFYRDQLGFSQSFQATHEGRPEHVVLRLGDSLLALSTPRAITAAGLRPTTGNAFELIVWCDDVDRETARLRAAGATVLAEPYRHVAGHRRAYIADPDGNWLALVDAEETR